MKLSLFIASLFIGGIASGATLRIDILVLNNSGTETNKVTSIALSQANAGRLQSAVDGQSDMQGTPLHRVRNLILKSLKEFTRDYERVAVNNAKLQELINAVESVEEMDVE